MRINTIGAKYLVVGATFAAFVAVLVAVVRSASAHIVRAQLRLFPKR